MARVAGEIDPLARRGAREHVGVSLEVARRVDEVEAAVVEEVDGVGEMGEGVPGGGLEKRGGRSFFFLVRPVGDAVVRRGGRIERRGGSSARQFHHSTLRQQVRLEVRVPA